MLELRLLVMERNDFAAPKKKHMFIHPLQIDTTCCTVVALDAEGNALRPCLLWADVRSAKQAAQVSGNKENYSW